MVVTGGGQNEFDEVFPRVFARSVRELDGIEKPAAEAAGREDR